LVPAAVLFEPAEKFFVTRGGAQASIAANHVEWPGTGVRLEFASASTPSAEQLDPAPGRVSYLIGNDPAKWRLDVRRYARVRYRGIYPGTDLLYHGSANNLEFDFVLQPGASPEAISLRFDAAFLRTDGALVAKGQTGEVRLHRPLAWQEINGKRVPVTARFAMRAANTAGFEVGSYDRDLPLIIDPIVQVATYYGGATGNETNIQMVTDPAGNVYLAGATTSVDLPQATFPGSPYGRPLELLQTLCFLTRMHPDGTTLDYAISFRRLGGRRASFYDPRQPGIYSRSGHHEFAQLPGAFKRLANLHPSQLGRYLLGEIRSANGETARRYVYRYGCDKLLRESEFPSRGR
jgi:hypothetical protein